MSQQENWYPWNVRMKQLRRDLRAFYYHLPACKSREELEQEVYEATQCLQPAEGRIVMRWANQAGVGPGFELGGDIWGGED